MRPTVAIVDLKKLQNNIQILKENLSINTQFMAIVKANAYGHGAVEIASQSILHGASWLGVAIPEEGVQLRQAGIDIPILILGGIDESQIDMLFEYGLSTCIFSYQMAEMLNHQGKRFGRKVGVHIKVDTGMGRIGLKNIDDIRKLCSQIKAMDYLHIEGIFTHFAVADDENDRSFTLNQLGRFNKILSRLSQDNIHFDWIHAANSAAILNYPDAQFNMVRGGIGMYGYSSVEGSTVATHLEPIMEWKTRVIYVKEVDKGDSISYGRTYIANQKKIIATLPVGYADGYNRLLGNRGWVLIKGNKAPIVGKVCMDQMMVDVTNIPNVMPGDWAILLGQQGQESISADDLAKLCNTISYEILVSISPRVPRIYIGGNR